MNSTQLRRTLQPPPGPCWRLQSPSELCTIHRPLRSTRGAIVGVKCFHSGQSDAANQKTTISVGEIHRAFLCLEGDLPGQPVEPPRGLGLPSRVRRGVYLRKDEGTTRRGSARRGEGGNAAGRLRSAGGRGERPVLRKAPPSHRAISRSDFLRRADRDPPIPRGIIPPHHRRITLLGGSKSPGPDRLQEDYPRA